MSVRPPRDSQDAWRVTQSVADPAQRDARLKIARLSRTRISVCLPQLETRKTLISIARTTRRANQQTTTVHNRQMSIAHNESCTSRIFSLLRVIAAFP